MENQRAAFEAWALEYNSDLTEWPNVLFVKNGSGKYAIIRVQDAWEAWQAALASPEVQALRERLQFLADEGCSINSRERTDGSLEYQLYWEQVMKWQDEWFDSPEEAIDHARRVEEIK